MTPRRSADDSLRRRCRVRRAGGGASCSRRSSARRHISLRRAFDRSVPFADNVDAQIFFVARLPRTLAGALRRRAARLRPASSSRALLRNPLATPFTLGVSAGAALGAMLAITFSWRSRVLGISARAGRPASSARSPPWRSSTRWPARRHRGLSTNVLLLAGVTLNAFFSALILFVQYFADFAETLPHAALADGRPRRRQLRAARGGAAAGRAVVRGVRLAGAAAEPAERSAPKRRGARRRRRRARSASRSSARRWRPARPSRSAARSASSASSSRTSSGCWSAPIIASCCRRRRSSAPRFSSAATSSRARCCRRSNCRSASSPRSSADRSSCGCSSGGHESCSHRSLQFW